MSYTAIGKPVKRLAQGITRRDVIITLYPTTIGLREKRSRKEYILPLSTVFKVAIEAERASKAADKKRASGKRNLVSRGLLR